MDEFQFEFKWKNYPSEEAIILTNYLFGSNVHSAVLSGEGKVVRDPVSGFTASGDVEFENSFIPIPFFENYILDGFRFREVFLFTPSKEEREFLGTDFRIKTSVKTETIKEPLLFRNFEFQIESLENIAERISDLSGNFNLPLSGSLKGNLELLESGDKNKWFQLQGELVGSEIEWDSSLLKLEKGTLSLKFLEGNEWSLNFDSLLFGKPSHLSGSGANVWGRSKKTDGSYYYPMSSKTKLNFQTPDLYGSDWKPLYEDWKQETLEEIRERQEKLIPEEYFYQTKIYKYFLESMNLDLGIQIANYYPFSGSETLGESKGNVLVKDGRMNLGLNLGSSNSKVSMISYFASKTPNFGFSLILNEYPWSDPWMNFCGAELKPTHVSLDYSFNSIGSDYYSLHKDARTSYSLKLFGVNFKEADLVSKLEMDLSPLRKPFQLEFDLSRYSDMDYISNLVVSSESLDLKGYGNNKNGNYAFTTYGLVGESRGSFSFTEEENKCVIK